MSIEATADALVGEKPVETPVDVDPDQELADVFDKFSAEEPVETPEPEAEPVEQVEVAEKPAEKVEVPSDLPREIRESWETIPEVARAEIVKSHRDFARQLSEQGRLVQGISPIRDVLVDAAKQFPALKDKKPDEVAREVFELARVSQDFNSKPVETIMGLVKKHGMEDAVRAALSGQPMTDTAKENSALKRQVADLQKQVQQFGNPQYLREQVMQITAEDRMTSEVQEFAGKAEHWAQVETYMPQFVEVARARNADGSTTDILKAAYDMAVNAFVEPKASEQPSGEDMVATDPERTAAAARAKSVNVTGKSTGKPKPLSEDDELAAVWDKAQKR